MLVATAQDAAELFRPLFDSARGEKLAVAFLDRERAVIEVREMGEGAGTDEVVMPVRRIMEEALRLGAAGLVVAHNHPSGNASPSAADLEATRELADVASRLGVRVHDHLIFAGGEMVSLRGMGLL
jgi:DNA repair protein RadC